jgi:site-specific DNA-methyltransferase (adenine-specific)
VNIEKISIADIMEYENNAKIHTPEQIEQIKKSIKEFGNNDPIAIDENNVIIEGHGRYQALLELGYKEVEVIRLNHLSEEQKKAYMLVHNKLTMNTDFDIELLSEELNNILDIDMNDFGFDIETIDLEELDDNFSLPDGDKEDLEQMTFTLHTKQAELIKYAMETILNNEEIEETFGNTNKNGNALYEVIRQWAEQRK